MDEITAEYSVEQLSPRVELQTRIRCTIAAKTDLGRVRENNEDKFEFYQPEDEGLLATKGLIFVVCDGMGGHAAGQLASELASKTFIDVFLHHPSTEVDVAAKAAVGAANRFVYDAAQAVPAWRGMGTTLSALMLVQDRAWIAHVGDSRVYRLRSDELLQLTTDHTWVEETVASGAMDRTEAEAHPYRHMLTRAVGTDPDVAVDVACHPLQAGDVFLLCSDGLLNHVADEAIRLILKEHSPSEAAWKLVGSALSGGGSDNTTVLVVRIDALEQAARG